MAQRGRSFENLSIRNKIMVGYGTMIVPFVALVAMFWGLVAETQGEVNLVQNEAVPFTKAVERVRLAGLRLISESSNYATLSLLQQQAPDAPAEAATGDPASARTAEADASPGLSLAAGEKGEMLTARAALAAAGRELAPFLEETGGGAEIYRDRLRAGLAELDRASRWIEDLVAQGSARDVVLEAIETLNDAENEFVATTTAALAVEEMEQTASSVELADTLSFSRFAVTGLGLAGLLTAIAGGLYIAGRIAAPIRQLSEQARRVGEGEFEALDRKTTGGEVGMLAGAIGAMVDNLRTMIDKMGRQQKLSALGQLAGTVGHDLRNPLAAIRTTLHTLRQTSQSKGFGIERSLDRMERSVERCTAIVADLLDFTRVRDLDRQATALDQWLGELLDDYKPAAGVALRRDIAGDIEAQIDRDRFRRVMINLIDNAAQAMTSQGWSVPEGRVPTVTVRAEPAGPHVRVAVADNGPGIAPETRAKIFEPLFTTKSSGVGLGLPIVRQIVEQHGGTIDVESAVDVGTTFTVFLPRQADVQSPARAAATEHAAA